MALFIATIMFGGALLLGGYNTGQTNPPGTPFIESDSGIVKYTDPWQD